MKTYRVVQDCVRMPFNKRRFRKDEIIDLEDNVEPGGCFELIEGPTETIPDTTDGMSLSEMQKKQKDLANPKSGFAANLGNIEPEKRAGRPRKKTAG